MKIKIFLFILFFILLLGCKHNVKPVMSVVNKSVITDTIKKPVVIKDVKPIRDSLQEIYYSQIGVREVGNNAGPEVEKYLESAGVPKGSAWCASFVYWTYQKCDSNFVIVNPAWVPSWFPKSKLIFSLGKIDKRSPQKGDLIGIYFPEKKRLAHIGFFDSESQDFIISVEGNTNDAGSREGDGVYKKKRVKRTVNSISSWIDK